MIITTRKANVLDFDEDFLAHGCNCHGVMGSGVAKAIRDKWPMVYKEYRAFYELNGLELGTVHHVAIPDGRGVFNSMTQFDFGTDTRKVDYEAVASCFEGINNRIPGKTLAIPLIGCGLAGGNWRAVSAIIDSVTPDVDITLYIQ